ncbi:MAG: ABC-2 transporter permease [Oscillospiraceae bacterium]|nr:ABC-2 transporter permease [Oscillospiraceae bacterium]
MKALLYKDFYALWKYSKMYLFMCGIFLAISVFEQSQEIFGLYPLVLMGMLPMTMVAYDERDNWERTALTMPFGRKQLVTEKYLFALLLMGGVFGLTALTTFLNQCLGGGFVLREYAAELSMRLLLAIVGPAFMLPPVFRFGAEKGRMAYLVTLAVIIGGGVAGALIINRMGLSQTEVNGLVIALTAAGAVLLLPVSWLLSVRFYEKREF